MGYAIRYRLRGSAGLCVGIAAGNGLYIVLVIIGWGVLRQAPLLFTVVELLGRHICCGLAVGCCKVARRR